MQKPQPYVYDHVGEIVRSYFGVRAHELLVGSLSVSEIVAEYGTPLFIYDQQAILAKVREARSVLPANFDLFYSIKANPNASILAIMLDEGCGLEVASSGELYQALEAGCSPPKILFAGPGKTQAELREAVHRGVGEIHIESVDEAACLNQSSREFGVSCNVALRINPIAGAGGAMRMGGVPSPFGIDEEDLDASLAAVLNMPNLHVSGLHLFMATQILSSDLLLAQYAQAVHIARRVAQQIPYPLKTIDFGGGWGAPYFAKDKPLDMQALQTGLAKLATEIRSDELLSGTRGIVEPGRYLVSEAGIYVTQVTRIKSSRGKVFAMVDGGMHHHLAASGNLGQTIKRNYPVAVLNKMGRTSGVKANVCGPLCTPLDVLARDLELPEMEAGDLVGIFQSGAYARAASPHGFLSHPTPAEVMVDNGVARLIRSRGTFDDFLRDQVGRE